MRINKFCGLAGAALLILLAGCAANKVNHGYNQLAKGNYDQALDYFAQILAENWGNAPAHRGLGEAYYHLQQFDSATAELERALHYQPTDGRAVLYLGLTREAIGDYAGAAEIYRRYVAAYPKEKISRRFKGRLLFVLNEDARQQVRDALEFEAPLIVDTTSAATLGVLPFLPLGDGVDSLRPVAAGLTALVTSDLSKIKRIKLVERTQLNYLLAELKRVGEGDIDDASAPRLGRLMGTSHLVRGDLAFLSGSRVAVQSGLVKTADSFYRLALDDEAEFARIWQLQKAITRAVVDSLGIKLTAAERQALEKLATRNQAAFLAYGRGIDAFDQGNYQLANDFFSQAASLDPDFEQAAGLVEESGLLIDCSGTADEFESFAGSFTPPGGESGPPLDEDIFDLTDQSANPRSDDNPVVGTGAATVRGTIR